MMLNFRTVIKNGTDLLRGTVDIYSFKKEMEERLTRTYKRALRYLIVDILSYDIIYR